MILLTQVLISNNQNPNAMGKQRHLNIAAWELSVAIGKQIQKRFKDIGEAYKTKTYAEIATEFKIAQIWHIRKKVAEMAVWYALHGCSKKMKRVPGTPYLGLIKEETLKEIADKHRESNGEIQGENAVIRGDGVHAISKQKRRAAIRKSHLVRNYTPYSTKELLFIFQCARNRNFWWIQGKNVFLKNAKIAEWANILFHKDNPIRSYTSIHVLFQGIQKGKKRISKCHFSKFKRIWETKEIIEFTLRHT